jgi:hypothetical protein
MSHLREDLANIVSDYTDLKTLEILNKIDPKIYTSDKLFVKKLGNIDRAAILKFSEAYRLTEKYLSDLPEQLRKYRIDPLFVSSEILKLHTIYEISEMEHDFESFLDITEAIVERIKLIPILVNGHWNSIFKKMIKITDMKKYPVLNPFSDTDMFYPKDYTIKVLNHAYSDMIKNTNIYHTTGLDLIVAELVPYVANVIESRIYKPFTDEDESETTFE